MIVSVFCDDENGMLCCVCVFWDDRFDEVVLFKLMYGVDVVWLLWELNV